MPLILIKNNLKLMLRSKWILFMMVILPVVTIALLSNAFHEMMNTSYKIDNFKAGYRVSDTSKYKAMLPELVTICKEQGITLEEFPQGDIKVLLQSEAVAAFVDITKDNSFTVYQSSEKEKESAVVESVFSGFFYQVNEAMTAAAYAKEQGSTEEIVQSTHKVLTEKLDTDPIPSSTDYYGIIYIVYFAWCGMVSLVAVISSERKSAIPRRLRVSHMPKLHYYFGKFIPCTLAIFIEVCSAWIISAVLFDIHWGRIGLSILIVLLISMAASAMGILLYQLFNNVAISIVVSFIITWIIGFFGGSFEAYMYLSIPKYLINSSPIYYVNRTLVEFSTKGYSDYFGKSLLFLSIIIILCGFVGIVLMNRKMEEE